MFPPPLFGDGDEACTEKIESIKIKLFSFMITVAADWEEEARVPIMNLMITGSQSRVFFRAF